MAQSKRWVNYLLFFLTVISTYFVGFLWAMNYVYAGQDLEDIPALLNIGIIFNPALNRLSLIYSLSLLGILLGHELGHYLTCKNYHIEATLPYFIPAPTLIGTLGAFIRIKSPLTRRDELFDIGANGPLAGFILSVPALYFGLTWSKLAPMTVSEGTIEFGEPWLLKAMTRVIFGPVPADQALILHPMAMAAWVGLLVTSFNLFPIGQLDGGHIFYSLFGDKVRKISYIIVALLVVMGIFFWAGWLIWAILILLFGLRHPPVAWVPARLSQKRQIIAFLVLIIFLVSFIPAPVTDSGLLDLIG